MMVLVCCRRRLNARLAELEDALETARGRAGKLEKDKNRLQIEIREVTAEYEAVSLQFHFASPTAIGNQNICNACTTSIPARRLVTSE